MLMHYTLSRHKPIIALLRAPPWCREESRKINFFSQALPWLLDLNALITPKPNAICKAQKEMYRRRLTRPSLSATIDAVPQLEMGNKLENQEEGKKGHGREWENAKPPLLSYNR